MHMPTDLVLFVVKNEVLHSHPCLVTTSLSVVLQLWKMDILPSLHPPTPSSLICIVLFPIDLPYFMVGLWKMLLPIEDAHWFCFNLSPKFHLVKSQ